MRVLHGSRDQKDIILFQGEVEMIAVQVLIAPIFASGAMLAYVLEGLNSATLLGAFGALWCILSTWRTLWGAKRKMSYPAED